MSRTEMYDDSALGLCVSNSNNLDEGKFGDEYVPEDGEIDDFFGGDEVETRGARYVFECHDFGVAPSNIWLYDLGVRTIRKKIAEKKKATAKLQESRKAALADLLGLNKK